jgi:hypothetical protein
MIAGACLPLIVGCAGLATDTIQWTLAKRQLQRAADSGALAGVYDRLASGGATASVPATVTHDLTLNNHSYFTLVSGSPVVTFPASAGVMTNQVRVTLRVQKSLPFSSMFMSAPPIIVANATAAAIPAGGDACVQALETSASKTGITNNGNADIYMPDCVMYSNSPSTNAASAGGSSSVRAKAIAAVGGIQQSNNWQVTSYIPYAPPLPDPFAGVVVNPDLMNCTTATLDEDTNFTAVAAAGFNCFSALSVGSNKTLNVPANFGPIYLNGGSADLQGRFTCTGCTIVLTNKTVATNVTIGTLSSNAQATTSITAPTSGPYKGIAIYQDRRATDCNGCNKVNGGATSIITGAMYFPRQEIWYNGGSSPTTTCTMIVGRRVVFTGNSKFKGLSECGPEGLPENHSVTMVRLVA